MGEIRTHPIYGEAFFLSSYGGSFGEVVGGQFHPQSSLRRVEEPSEMVLRLVHGRFHGSVGDVLMSYTKYILVLFGLKVLLTVKKSRYKYTLCKNIIKLNIV
jgi:hypothetical protein